MFTAFIEERSRRQGHPDPGAPLVGGAAAPGLFGGDGAANVAGAGLPQTDALIQNRRRYHRGRIFLMFTGIIALINGRFRGYRQGKLGGGRRGPRVRGQARDRRAASP